MTALKEYSNRVLDFCFEWKDTIIYLYIAYIAIYWIILLVYYASYCFYHVCTIPVVLECIIVVSILVIIPIMITIVVRNIWKLWNEYLL